MATAPAQPSVESMTNAAQAFVDSLTAAQRERTTYEYMDAERIFWYYPPINRHGLPLRDMTPAQRELAYTLMRTGLTERSYGQAVEIIDLELILGEIERQVGRPSFKRDPELYYWTIFGSPADPESPWGWRVEGHHVSLNYSLWGDRVISLTPFFFGSNPAEVRAGPRNGLRILDDREVLAYELMHSLDEAQRSVATIYSEAPWDILTYNASRVSLPPEQGLPASEFTDVQRDLLRRLVGVYVEQAPADVAAEKWRRIESAGFDGLHWAWAGPVDRSEPHYYRIHGGNFVVEFDNRQNGANHIHSVWRDIENDFANDVLGEHLLLYHVL